MSEGSNEIEARRQIGLGWLPRCNQTSVSHVAEIWVERSNRALTAYLKRANYQARLTGNDTLWPCRLRRDAGSRSHHYDESRSHI